MKKLIVKFLFLQIFFLLNLFAQVNLNMPNSVIENEAFIFEIEVSGEDIKFPKLDIIDGNTVLELSSSTSTIINNNQISKKIKKTYSFYPKQDFVFPSLEFIIDGKQEITKAKNIVLKKAQKTVSDIFDLSIKASKEKLYVGENFILTIIFKYKKDAQIVDLFLDKPSFENFWYKQINESSSYDDGDFKVQELKFLLTPLKSGILKIAPISINAQVLDTSNGRYSMFSSITKNLKLYSNELNFDVNNLPQNVKLIGQFDINSTIDKNKINQGEAVSYKLKIDGIGNIDDIEDIKLDIPNCVIYENKPLIKTVFENNEYKGSYEKVFSIIPNESILINPISIKYFDKEKNEVKTINSKSFNIEVVKNSNLINLNNQLQKKAEEIEVVKVIEKSSFLDKIIYFCLGVIVTLILLYIYISFLKKKKTNQEYNTPLIKKVKKSQDKEELIKILAAYLNKDKNLDNLIFTLEKSNDFLIIKKEIIKVIKDLKL